MWLAEETPVHDDPGSPPLEGGEALCEFMVENTTEQDLHHINMLRNLPNLLEENKAICIKEVLPKLQAVLPNSHVEVQLEASNSILTILERELVPTTTFTQTFLQSILTSVDSKDPIVANAWLETLMDVIDLLPQDIIKKDILTLAVVKGQHSQPVTSRLASCKILGKICEKFEPFFIKKEILPLVQSLCQDVDYEVRSCIAYQLDSLARGLGLELARNAILPWLVELANDEATQVRLASIETVVNMLSLLDDETCIHTIIPLVKKFCEISLHMEDAALPIVSKQLGRLCHGLSVNLKFEEKQWFLSYFRQLAQLGLPQSADDDRSTSNRMPDVVPSIDGFDKYVECRQNCAFNFPAMVLFAQPINFTKELLETFCDLTSDPHSKVRYSMACGFHEVAKLLGPNVHVIQHQLVLLLQDDCLEIIEGLVSNLPVALEALARGGSMNVDNKLENADSVISGLITCERTVSTSNNWRLHADILSKFSCLPHCLSSENIYCTFVPLFFHKLYTVRPIPCRIAAATTLLVFLRNNPVLEQRKEICSRILDELCNGYSCHKRMLFLHVCDIAMEMFSKAFFKANFFIYLLKLADDPVPNIRLRLCTMLPSLKDLITLPNDQHLFQSLETCVRKMMANEQDKDAAAALRNAIQELDKIELVDTTHRCLEIIKDPVDSAKEEAEKVLFQMEKQLRIRPLSEKDKNDERVSKSSANSRIPFRGKKAGPPSASSFSGIKASNDQSGIAKRSMVNSNSSPVVSRQKNREIKSAIPVSKRMSFPSHLTSCKVSPDSPMPSPETIRKVSSVPAPPVRNMKALGNTNTETNPPITYRNRYNSHSSFLSLDATNSSVLSPRPQRSFSAVAQDISLSSTESKTSNHFIQTPRCSTPPLFGEIDNDELDLEFCDQLILAAQLSDEEEDDPPSDPWPMESEMNIQSTRCGTPPVFSIQDDTLESSQLPYSRSTRASPLISETEKKTNTNQQKGRQIQSGIPRFRSNTPPLYNIDRVNHDRKANSSPTTKLRSTNTVKNPSNYLSSSSSSDLKRYSQKNQIESKFGKQPLNKVKNVNQSSPGFARKFNQSFIPRASRSPMGKSPSAPGTPRCMSPVQLQVYGNNRHSSPTRTNLHLSLNQNLHSHLAGRKFFSRPGSPASVCSDSDGQATPDSPYSYGSNESLSSELGNSSALRLRRYSGGSPSKIPSLIPRSASSYRRKES